MICTLPNRHYCELFSSKTISYAARVVEATIPPHMSRFTLVHPAGCQIPADAKPLRVLGIDLGTTNSTVAEIRWDPTCPAEAELRCLDIDQETGAGIFTGPLVPSVVALDEGRTLVGEGAKRLLARGLGGGEEFRSVFAECKNDIGSRRTYHKAPPGFRSPSEIASHVLRFLYDSACKDQSDPVDRVVVTVPASFQSAQRLDTVKAAQAAGVPLGPGDLLDEPVAAFLNHLLAGGDGATDAFKTPRNMLVLDFGGGTCDVAIFRPHGDLNAGNWRMNPLAVSRYHRLGGGDIDRAIVHEVLLPQFLDQNGMRKFDLGFDARKREFEPALLGVAEALKVGICAEIVRLHAFGKYDRAVKSEIVHRLPGAYPCQIDGRAMSLREPCLDAAQWEAVIAPFLDTNLLVARESEYRLTCSVFAPVCDALDRAGLGAEEIGLCMLVGGSCQIPQVRLAAMDFFENADVVMSMQNEPAQLVTANGAAYHALCLTLFGKGLFRVVCPDSIFLQTQSGPVELVPGGVELPWPPNGEKAADSSLRVPDKVDSTGQTELRVEIFGGDESRLLLSELVTLVGVENGEPLKVEYRLDENQAFDFTLRLANQSDARPFEVRVENPLSNIVNPHAIRMKIQQTEEDLRTGKVKPEAVPQSIVELAKQYAEIEQLEKAVSYLNRALRMLNRRDGHILNLLGIYHGELGDTEREEMFYREAAAASANDPVPFFNLALAKNRWGKTAEAREIVNQSLSRGRTGPSLVLLAQIEEGGGNITERNALLAEAIRIMGAVSSLGDWELGWLATAARMTGDKTLADMVNRERQSRKSSGRPLRSDAGNLPDIAR